MPTTPPFDTIETILNATRVRMNDAIQSLGGEVLTDNAVFTPQMVNSAYRRFQRRLSQLDAGLLRDQVTFLALPAVANSDPATQPWMDWTGYSADGASVTDASFAFPQTCIQPISFASRANGSTDNFDELDNPVENGLPMVQKQDWLQQWEWRSNKAYFVGALALVDLVMRFDSYLADFAAPINPASLVPIVQCLDPFSLYIMYEASFARNDMDAESILEKADQAALMVAARDSEKARNLLKQSELGKMADATTERN